MGADVYLSGFLLSEGVGNAGGGIIRTGSRLPDLHPLNQNRAISVVRGLP